MLPGAADLRSQTSGFVLLRAGVRFPPKTTAAGTGFALGPNVRRKRKEYCILTCFPLNKFLTKINATLKNK